MTCVVAVAHMGRVYMGADSAGVGGLQLRLRKDPKVFKRGEFLFGFTSSFRMGQLLHHNFTPPIMAEGSDVDGFMSVFISSVRECLKTGGYSTKVNEQEAGGEFLVGFRSRIFHIHTDFQVGELLHPDDVDPYDACGCGEDYAMGALYALRDAQVGGPERRILTALQTAEAHSAGVRRPFTILSTP